ncbi:MULTISPECIES: long-chain fatty acid--CoA ligase [unclassified Novosphingobium]|uniref:AMP-dependent synthetase/ligase n=1 Tax=unclassified Novosphingobium TaxID=2644732 RepID=UPI000EEDC8FE|nr:MULTISPECIES: long-chain fatty acid--CoA ligase [unclassified Novosphingobium]HCF25206.1 long-chain fatty acid--CoA ligase [Novosphingobium sp.]HQV02381.1 long-chain fatty acid--CoA ligase [Novosphingobium sp.]
MVDISDLPETGNLVELLLKRADAKGEAPFLWAKHGGKWQAISWAEAARQVCCLAESLRAMGLKDGDRVMLVSENRPEWCIADFAIMAAGCITVPAYVTNTERDHQHILEDSGASAVIVANDKLSKPLIGALLRTGHAKHVIGIEPLKIAQASNFEYHDWQKLIVGDGAPARAAVNARIAKIGRQDTACLIYTSGTGGAPRGVMQHHGAILMNADGAARVLNEDFGLDDDDAFLSFLPLSHAYEHTGGQMLPVSVGAQIYYAEGLEKLASNIEETRPTVMVVVPRLFEVLRARIMKQVEKQGKVANYLMDRAMGIGAKKAAGRGRWRDKPMDIILEKTLRPKIRARFGGRMKAMVSGGAPLSPEVGVFFESMGLTMLQGYGQTEAGPVISCNRPRAGLKMDTVGPPLHGVELKIAEDGEILVRGELVMHGYWRNQAETDKALQNGWLHTGDIGHLDEAGRLMITDRKKDMIVNDKGDNISPARVEGLLTLQPEIAQAMVVGDRRPYVVGLVVPDPEWAIEWAQANGEKFNMKALQALPAFRSAVRAALDRVNQDLSVIEKVRQFTFADEPFTIDNEELTPKQSIRRHKLKARYGERLDALYKG